MYLTSYYTPGPLLFYSQNDSASFCLVCGESQTIGIGFPVATTAASTFVLNLALKSTFNSPTFI